MRRLRTTDGTPSHRKAARYHLGKLTSGSAPLHADLKSEMAQKYAALKAISRAVEDAEDDAVEASATADHAEVTLENTTRDLDADLGKLDRQEPSLAARASVFPNGYGSEIDPEGDAQLEHLPALRTRIEKFANHGVVADALVKFDDATAKLKLALGAENAAYEKVEKLFQDEQDARRVVREQIESAYGRLRDFYKSRPALAEAFFLKEGSRKAQKKLAEGETKTP